MAFVSRIGNILKQAGSKHINIQSPGSNLSLYQAIRCMSSSKLFVGGISWNTDEQSLREVFAKYGEVIEARIIMDRESGRSRGFGFVSFTSTEEASSAIQALDNQVLHGRTIKVNFAMDKPRGGFGGGGNYGVGGGTYGGNYGGGNYGGNYQGGGGNYGGNYQGGGGGSYGGNYQGGGGGSNGGDYQGGGGSYEGTGNDYAGGNGNYSSGGVSSFDGGNSGNYVGGGGAGGDRGFTGASGDSGFTGAGGDSGFTGAGYSSTTGTGGGDDESFARDPLEVSTRDDFDEPDDVSNTKG